MEAYDDINLLDIGRHSSRFYSQRFEQFLYQRDSVKSVNTDPMSYLQFLANTFGSKKGREYEVYKHIPQRGTLTYTDVVHNDFIKGATSVPCLMARLCRQLAALLGKLYKLLFQFVVVGYCADVISNLF